MKYYLKEIIIYFSVFFIGISLVIFLYSTGFNFNLQHLEDIFFRLLAGIIVSFLNAVYFTLYLVFHSNKGKYLIFTGDLISLLFLQDRSNNLFVESLISQAHMVLYTWIEIGCTIIVICLIAVAAWMQISAFRIDRSERSKIDSEFI